MNTNTLNNKIAEAIFQLEEVSVYYGDFEAVRQVNMDIPKNKIIAFIGPSGCGKSTLLRCFNRLNDLIPGAKVTGRITYHDRNLYGKGMEAVEVRRRIGMVFQKPNPFPKSIYDNIAFGARVNGYRGNMDELVERSLVSAALWDEVKDKLKQSGLSLSGGQQQRLCIARAIATQPEVILMDEPFGALDEQTRSRLHGQLEKIWIDTQKTIVFVTHSISESIKLSDRIVVMGTRPGTVIADIEGAVER